MPTREITLREHPDNFISSGAEGQSKVEWLRGAAQESIYSLERGDGKSFASIDELAANIRELGRRASATVKARRSGVAS